jgi:Uma2 family endonuclease
MEAMSALPKRFFTPEEYLELEVKAEYKSQYVGGEIFAMAGAQPSHDQITGNIIIALGLRFRGRSCNVFTSDLRVRAAKGDLYTYPDVTALCGKPEFDGKPGNPPSLLNPQVIFEVLSPSTEGFDRGEKFTRYRKLESLTDYVLVSTERMGLEHFVRQTDHSWTFKAYEHPDEQLVLANVGCEIPLSEIYDKVAFPTI